MNVADAVLKRKSIRSYKDKEVSDEDLAKVVKAGQWTPNAGPYTMAVIRDKDLIRRINDKTLEAMRTSGSNFLMERAALPGYLPLYGSQMECGLALGHTDDETRFARMERERRGTVTFLG